MTPHPHPSSVSPSGERTAAELAATLREWLHHSGAGKARHVALDDLCARAERGERVEAAARAKLEADRTQPPARSSEHPWDRDPKAIEQVLELRVTAEQELVEALEALAPSTEPEEGG
jgi:hypothetical protein